MNEDIENTPTDETNHKWYHEYPKATMPYKHSKTEFEVSELQAEAKKYLEAEISVFQLKQSKICNSETSWLNTALAQGTSSDKIAASVIFIQENPKYNLARLISLISQVRVGKHNQSDVVVILRDLFLTELLHPKSKLLKFHEQNLNKFDNIGTTDVTRKKLLAHWYFEDQLSEQYERFISSLAAIAVDTVEANREKTVSVLTDLLIGNAEQEHKLLELIVNKIGDPSSKVGSKAIYCLNKLLKEHPNMKLVVLREVEKLLFRRNVAQRAQYYAICLLSQFVLSKRDDVLAGSLMEVYFAFFKACLKKGEPDSRMMAAILQGVNRAYPFAKTDSNILNNHIDSVYKVVHIGSFTVSFNALTLLYQVTGKNEAQCNRFYSAFYRKLLDPQIGIANKRAIFLNLLFRALRNDHNTMRLHAFIKRILQIVLFFPANMACATLYVVSKIIHTRKDLKHIFKQIETYIKTEDDSESKERSLLNFGAESVKKVDTVIKTEDSIILPNVTIETDTDFKKESEIKEIKIECDKEYDPFCRNPLYAGASKSLKTELNALSKHYHPSVALFANAIIQGKIIDYTGDPLQDLTLIRFLDRYVFKNPKQLDNKKIQKKNNPLAQRAGYTPIGVRSIPVNSKAYFNKREEQIPVDELYLYQYLKKKNQFKYSVDNKDDDNESVNSDEFNDMLDKLGKNDNFEDFDIAGDIKIIKNKRKDNKNNNNSQDNEGDDSDLDESIASEINNEEEHMERLSDIDFEGLGDEDLSDIDLELDNEALSDVDFDDNLDDLGESFNDQFEKRAKTRNISFDKNIKTRKGHSKGGNIDNNVFVSAEKFAEMLEEQSRIDTKHGSTNMLSNVDGASFKQLDWESKRNYRLTRSFQRKKRKPPKTMNVKNRKKFKR